MDEKWENWDEIYRQSKLCTVLIFLRVYAAGHFILLLDNMALCQDWNFWLLLAQLNYKDEKWKWTTNNEMNVWIKLIT